jgi:ATP-binding cassette subfamily F protein 3
MAAVYLQIQNVFKAFGDDELLNDVSLQVREGECVGLIGPNGAGKSTLFRMIIGREHADTGLVVVPRGVRVGHLAQEDTVEDGGTVLADVLASRADIVAIHVRMHALEADMSEPGAHDNVEVFDRLLHEHHALAEQFHHLGGDTLEMDAKRILRGLGLDETFDDAEVMTLSGGQKRRVALAKLLLAAPDLLLLDEPTNHLDLAAITWLEDYIKAYRGGVLIVSHDRYLIDRVANHIAEVEDTRLRQFDGNYTAYHVKKEAENAMLQKRADTVAREKVRLEASIQRLFSFRLFTRMRSLQKQLYKLEQVRLPGEAEKTRIRFKPSRPSSKEVLTVQGLRKRFTEAPLIEDLTFTLWRGERVAVLGPNGCGKTTLLRLLVGEQWADKGTTQFGQAVEWYYYDQEGRNLDPRNTVLQETWQMNPQLPPNEVRGALARFLIFGEDVERSVSTLSGGERSRVSLTKLFLSGANLLLLDEPTNHLDIDGKEALEEALLEYPGTVLMVSHDRYFIDRVATRVLEVENGRAREYHGNYTDYLAKKAQNAAAALAALAPPPAPKRKPVEAKAKPVEVKAKPVEPKGKPAEPKAATPAPTKFDAPKRRSPQYWMRRQMEVEAQVADLEVRKSRLEEQLADPALYSDAKKSIAVTEEHQRVSAELDAAYAVWAEVGEELQLAGGGK